MESPPIIEMSGKDKKQEKSHLTYEKRFNALISSTQEQLADYKSKLEDESFEDKEGEQQGQGEKRKEEMQRIIRHGMDRIENMKAILDSGQDIPHTTTTIEANYTYTNPQTKKVEKQESITLDIEKALDKYTTLFQETGIQVPQDFKEQIEDIWTRNSGEIEKAIEEQGFDDMIIAPANIPLEEISKKMKMGNGYYDFIKSSKTVSDLTGIPFTSTGVDKARIILIHKTQNIKDRPELKTTLGIKAQDIKIENSLSLEDYLYFQRNYFKETNKHLDEDGWTWLTRTKSGSRFVVGGWGPGAVRLNVVADSAGYSYSALGCRPSRYFT